MEKRKKGEVSLKAPANASKGARAHMLDERMARNIMLMGVSKVVVSFR